MRHDGLLNPELQRVVTGIGHTQRLFVVDAGFPLPAGVDVVDLSVVAGSPSFVSVVRALAAELVVEGCTVADETLEQRPDLVRELEQVLPGVVFDSTSHEELKVRSAAAYAIVRTGECTPYANVAFSAGTSF